MMLTFLQWVALVHLSVSHYHCFLHTFPTPLSYDGGMGKDNLHPVGDDDRGSGDGDAGGGDDDWNAEMGEELYDGDEQDLPARGDGGDEPGANDDDDEEEAPGAYRSARLESAAERDAMRAVQDAAHRAAYGSE